MPDNQRSDGWQALRARLETSPRSRLRGSWVPQRPSPSSSQAASGAPTDEQQPPRPAATPARPPLSRSHLVVVVLVVAVCLLGTGTVLVSAQPRTQSVPLATATGTAAPPGPTGDTDALLPLDETETPPVQTDEVVVHVAGSVRRPGVVRLPAGSRVIDAVAATGGELPGTDLSTVNLARVLTDGEQIRVGLPPDPTLQSSSVAASAAGAPGPLSLNIAAAADLESLPGIGPVLAARIVAYREQSGPFRSVDQLIEVAGIGPAVLESLDGLVTV